jgi:CheY-like chemotaxis protein
MAHILVIDDEADIRALLAQVLEREGHEVTTAGDGSEALEAVNSGKHDIAMVDLFMPEIDGLELIPKLCERDPDIRIIAMSGGAATGQAGGLLQAAETFGAVASLPKPFQLSEVRELVAGLLS